MTEAPGLSPGSRATFLSNRNASHECDQRHLYEYTVERNMSLYERQSIMAVLLYIMQDMADVNVRTRCGFPWDVTLWGEKKAK